LNGFALPGLERRKLWAAESSRQDGRTVGASNRLLQIRRRSALVSMVEGGHGTQQEDPEIAVKLSLVYMGFDP